jgi:ketosteroid isomerase-like protein
MSESQGNVRIHELLDYVQQGRIMDAMNEFYAEDVVMEEPLHGTTVGLAANLAREEQFLASVKEFRNFEAKNVGVGDNASLYEAVMDWTDVDGNEFHVEQTAVAEWKDGQIVRERFYYDTK